MSVSNNCKRGIWLDLFARLLTQKNSSFLLTRLELWIVEKCNFFFPCCDKLEKNVHLYHLHPHPTPLFIGTTQVEMVKKII
jgi:hypothetical protein